jgi:hypothetical protein
MRAAFVLPGERAGIIHALVSSIYLEHDKSRRSGDLKTIRRNGTWDREYCGCVNDFLKYLRNWLKAFLTESFLILFRIRDGP